MVDVSQPSTARIHDLFRGGTDNYESDQIAALRIHRLASTTEEVLRGARRVALRTVRHLARHHRIGQFLDLGCGLPDVGVQLHEAAQKVRRNTRFVYVDRDPMVLAHGGMMLETNDHTRVIKADLRDGAAGVFTGAEEGGFYHLDQPGAALLGFILDELDDADADRLVGDVRARLASGSYLVLYSLVSADQQFCRRATALLNELVPTGGRVRPPGHVAGFLTGLKRTRPLGDVTTWYSPQHHATVPPTGWIAYGGIARIP
ncbi:hypothetical protein DMB38_25965 [Streptomyces sp. WAC 06738]|uniref:SAM-dependent methyltransferase n=1 Tax=Streptomyces sp. WAC 06738 TaxID=2203210 RepID=UPI000F6D79F7|nr:SAM-dependent methyltransferase [Streptomyces sp. WAC 06738]AZM48763.1 hypothetical protein DMB38_25965 [Streptomyces sp. WAC 06738]